MAYRDARADLQGILAEVESFFHEEMPKLVEAMQSIPELVAVAKEEASRAADTITDLESIYGGGLYAPPTL